MYTGIVISVLQYIYIYIYICVCVGYHSDPYVKKETRLLQTRATNHVLDEVVCCLGLPHPAAEGLRTSAEWRTYEFRQTRNPKPRKPYTLTPQTLKPKTLKP